MTSNDPRPPIQPDVVADSDGDGSEPEPDITQPTKLIRMASMTRAMLEEVRHAPPDEAGRRRLLEIHERSLEQLRGVLSSDLKRELDGIFLPLAATATPTESELRIAQAQLVGWLEGLFHGIQASLFTQQAAAQRQLVEMRTDDQAESGDGREYPGIYL